MHGSIHRAVDVEDYKRVITRDHPSSRYVPALSPDFEEVHIPETFRDNLVKYLTLIRYPHAKFRPSRVFAIVGKPGDGKTFMTTATCSRLGCNVFVVPSADLSGRHEGDAHKGLRDIYSEAKQLERTTNRPSVILLDDWDTSVAAIRSNSTYSVNSQLLEGWFQNLANDNFESDPPLPIIVTANDLTPFREPLVRHGRLKVFRWVPSWQDKFEMASGVFPPNIDRERLKRLVYRYHRKGQPFDFFVVLLSDYFEEKLAPSLRTCRDITEAAKICDETLPRILNNPPDYATLDRVAGECHRRKIDRFVTR